MKLLFRALLTLTGIVLIVVLYVSFSHRPEPMPAGSDSARRLEPGPFPVASYKHSFVDPGRPTPANRDFPGAPERVLDGEVWYPEGGRAAPLLVFSHGFTSTYRNGRHFAEHLASHGFVVVAADYPLTAMGAPGGPNIEDVGNQPGDVSLLINTVIAQGEEPGHPLHGIVDGERVGVFGISLGGLTSTLAGFHPQWRDPRIDAVISIAGPTEIFKGTFFEGAGLPFLMLAGDKDVLVPHAYNAAPVPGKVPGGELVTIAGGSHTGFSAGTAVLRWMENTDAIGCWSVQNSIDPGAEEGWAGLLGDESLGIDYSAPDRLCKVDPLPPAMNVLRQQMISKLVVRAFFERELAAEPARRERAAGFLEKTLPAEIEEVSYVGAQLPGA